MSLFPSPLLSLLLLLPVLAATLLLAVESGLQSKSTDGHPLGLPVSPSCLTDSESRRVLYLFPDHEEDPPFARDGENLFPCVRVTDRCFYRTQKVSTRYTRSQNSRRVELELRSAKSGSAAERG